MTTILLMLSAAAAIAFFTGVAVTCLGSANKVSELEKELANSISMDKLTYYLHECLLPNKMKNSASWNAALLDLEKRIEWDRNNDRG